MSYRYLGTSIKKADKEIQCDVIRCFFERKRELVVKMDIALIVRYKDKKIKIGDEYIEHLILDEETGEECALNVLTELDKVGKRNNLYPPEVQNQIK